MKLCDFGSSRDFKKPGSGNGSGSFTSLRSQIIGSVQWMAPEVIKQEIAADEGRDLVEENVDNWKRADVWSIGCTLVEMWQEKY